MKHNSDSLIAIAFAVLTLSVVAVGSSTMADIGPAFAQRAPQAVQADYQDEGVDAPESMTDAAIDQAVASHTDCVQKILTDAEGDSYPAEVCGE